ncbi:MAG: universal stress protein [Chloroflexi bacterium]|nr:universal stress protein [Chloroflexota bacterium]
MRTTILVPLDGSEFAERAVPYAAQLAVTMQAHLILFHVMHDVPAPVRAWNELDIAARIEHLAGQLRMNGVQTTAQTVVGEHPAARILRAADEQKVDILVMSTHGASGLGRWLYGSVADAVLNQARVPVLLVPSTSHHPWPKDRPLKVMVPLDGSDLSEAALGPARKMAQAIGGQLLLTRVVEPTPDIVDGLDPLSLSFRRPGEADLEMARAYLDDLAAAQQPTEQPVDTLVDEGRPGTVLAALARQEGVDLIVMATHGRTGLARLTMGSVATATVQRAHVPVLLVRPEALSRRAEEVMTDSEERVDEAVLNAWPPVGDAHACVTRLQV